MFTKEKRPLVFVVTSGLYNFLLERKLWSNHATVHDQKNKERLVTSNQGPYKDPVMFSNQGLFSDQKFKGHNPRSKFSNSNQGVIHDQPRSEL